MARRVLLIVNPSAARTNSKALRLATSVLEGEGCHVDTVEPAMPEDAATLARSGVAAGVDVIAVYGGDGTIMQAFDGMVGHDVPLGIIPGGTGNLLAGNLRVPRNSTEAARTIARGTWRVIDLGRVEQNGTARHFAVNCGAGYDAELMIGTSHMAKERWGMAAYMARVLGTMSDIAPVRYRLTVDGVPSEFEASTVLVANCGELIPRVLRLGPAIAMDDGVLDVVALRARGAVDALGVIWQLVRDRPTEPRVRRLRGRRVTVETASPCPVQLDGEPLGVTPFTVFIVPGALRVLVPSHSEPDGSPTAGAATNAVGGATTLQS